MKKIQNLSNNINSYEILADHDNKEIFSSKKQMKNNNDIREEVKQMNNDNLKKNNSQIEKVETI